MTQDDLNAMYALLTQYHMAYHIWDNPIVEDATYDELFNRIQQIEVEHPEWIIADAPTQRVGQKVTGLLPSIQHHHPMLSLDNAWGQQDIIDWLARLGPKSTDMSIVCEPKIDGLAVNLYYRAGQLQHASTRGDGHIGEDITHNVKTIGSVALRLQGAHYMDDIEIRGEIFMTKSDFEQLNTKMKADGRKCFANPRNAAAGTMRQLDPQIAVQRSCKFFAYAWVNANAYGMTHHSQALDQLASWGLATSHLRQTCKGLKSLMNYHAKIAQKRGQLPFHIDGVVYKVDDLAVQQHLGATQRAPRWAIAHKFKPDEVVATVKAITCQVGRTGVVTPVVSVDPVNIGGVCVQHASLHNFTLLDRLDIRKGDRILMRRAGDVIPQVVKVCDRKAQNNNPKYLRPQRCPSCGATLIQDAQAVAWRCPASWSCPDQKHNRFSHMVSKPCFDIDGCGSKILALLIAHGLLDGPSDLFILTHEQLSALPGMGDRSAQLLIEQIDASRSIPLSRFIHALGVPGIGKTTSAILANKLSDYTELLTLRREDLINLEGFGDKMADQVVVFFQDQSNQAMMLAMIQQGVKPIAEHHDIDKHPKIFEGRIMVITGQFPDIKRDKFVEQLQQHGAKVVNQVSSRVTDIVVGLKPGSKLAKAQHLGIHELTYGNIIRLLED